MVDDQFKRSTNGICHPLAIGQENGAPSAVDGVTSPPIVASWIFNDSKISFINQYPHSLHGGAA